MDQREAGAKAKREVEKRDAVLKAESRCALRRIQLERPDPLPIRRLHCLGQVHLQGHADARHYTAEKLIGWGHEVHTWVDDLPHPLIDKHNKVMAVVAGAPKGDEIFWRDINERATKDATRLHSRGEFSLSSQEQFIQFGFSFGEIFRSPHILSGTPDTNREIEHLQASPTRKAMSAYHNHLYQQFAPPRNPFPRNFYFYLSFYSRGWWWPHTES
ncbi:hypothetical protein C8R43DRAFT_1143185 [Mycena crocata]|nr:hypothetical protein C8R43DRAFT_1143185 [Mycena crocata]